MSASEPRLPVLRDRIAIARAVAVAIFVVVAVSSAVHTWPDTWDAFSRERANFVGKKAPPPLDNAALGVAVIPGVLDFYASQLRAGDRYAFQVPEDMPAGQYQSLLSLSGLALLPAIRVEDRAKADVLLSYNADPRETGAAGVHQQYGPLPFFATRLRP